jgi:hypothetical protein
LTLPSCAAATPDVIEEARDIIAQGALIDVQLLFVLSPVSVDT